MQHAANAIHNQSETYETRRQKAKCTNNVHVLLKQLFIPSRIVLGATETKLDLLMCLAFTRKICFASQRLVLDLKLFLQADGREHFEYERVLRCQIFWLWFEVRKGHL